jgi:sec-independent protein translocase protein TatA
MLPFGFHPIWLIVLLVIVLIIFGPGKLPALGGAVGRSMREFRKASSELTEEVKKDLAADRLDKHHGSSVSQNTSAASQSSSTDVSA